MNTVQYTFVTEEFVTINDHIFRDLIKTGDLNIILENYKKNKIQKDLINYYVAFGIACEN